MAGVVVIGSRSTMTRGARATRCGGGGLGDRLAALQERDGPKPRKSNKQTATKFPRQAAVRVARGWPAQESEAPVAVSEKRRNGP